MSVSFAVYRISSAGERELVHTTQSARDAREVRDAGPGEMIVVGRDRAANDRERRGDKILGDLEMLTDTIDRDRVDLSKLTTSSVEREDIRHQIVRCYQGLRELAVELEAQEPKDDNEADFPI